MDLSQRGRLRGVARRDLAGRADVVAPMLLGTLLVRREEDGSRTVLRIVETEAYTSDDPASHSCRGQRTSNATMFGPIGHAYVYFTYGMHHCVNVTCGPEDDAAAVLVRGGVVLSGLPRARARRPNAATDAELAAGPGRLTRALGLDRDWDGADLCDRVGDLRLVRDQGRFDRDIQSGPRVGVRRAADRPWRWWLDGADGVSYYRRHADARPEE